MKIYIPLPLLEIILHEAYDFKFFKARIHSDFVKNLEPKKGHWVIDTEEYQMSNQQVEECLQDLKDVVSKSIKIDVNEKWLNKYETRKIKIQ